MSGRVLTQRWWTHWLSTNIAETPSFVCAFVRSFAVTSSPKRSRKKQDKNPEQTKVKKTQTRTRQLSGYNVFLKETSAKLRSLGLPVVDVMRQVAKEWTELSIERRQKYIDAANQLNASLKDNKDETSSKPVTKKSRTTTAMATNPYSHFCKSVWPSIMQQYPDKTFAERSRIVGEMWRNLSPEEKARRKEAVAGGTVVM